MAQQVQVLLTDDLDGTEATDTIQFGLDGTTYEIDLNDINAKQLRDAFAPWVEHGRKAGTQPAANGTPRRPRRNSATRERTAGIRAWARQKGYEVSDFGRISPKIVDEYDAAHQ